MAYDIIMAGNLLNLIDFMKEKIEEGWEPLGAPFISKNGEDYAQTIIRKQK